MRDLLQNFPEWIAKLQIFGKFFLMNTFCSYVVHKNRRRAHTSTGPDFCVELCEPNVAISRTREQCDVISEYAGCNWLAVHVH